MPMGDDNLSGSSKRGACILESVSASSCTVPFSTLLAYLNCMYCSIPNRWAYFATTKNGGVGLLPRVGLFSGDYSSTKAIASTFICCEAT